MKSLNESWYSKRGWTQSLKPLSAIFAWGVTKRRSAYREGRRKVWKAPVPVLVVGNICVGGVGKTPLVAELCAILSQQGWRPGVVSRGYGGKASSYPYRVTDISQAQECGDEPLLLHRKTGCPVVVAPERVSAGQYLLKETDCNLIISDDGLQHYALARDIELAVVDGSRGLGNGQMIPAGPLREPEKRLNEVDFLLVNGTGFVSNRPSWEMNLQPGQLVNLVSKEQLSADALVGQGPVHAVAGIGNPKRFFESLGNLGYTLETHEFRDHHPFEAKDIWFGDSRPVIMTEKDAVKCDDFANQNCWYLQVTAQLEMGFDRELLAQLAALQ